MQPGTGFLKRLHQEAGSARSGLLLVACLSGLSQTLILVLINAAAAAPGQAGLRPFILFLLALALYVLCTRRTYERAVAIVEALVQRIRRQLVARIEQVELEDLEALGTAEIYEQLTEHTATLSNSADNLAYFLQTAFTALFAALYLAWLSPPVLVLLAGLFAVALGLYRLRLATIDESLQALAQRRLDFIHRLDDLLSGFKEVLLHRGRSRALHEALSRASDSYRQDAQHTAERFFDSQLHAYVAGFAVLAAIGFVVPRHLELNLSTLAQLVCAALYFRGVAYGVAVGVPAYMHSQHAVAAIADLEQRLAAVASEDAAPVDEPWHGQPLRIAAQSLEYEYRKASDGSGFHLGPVSLEVTAGEIVFLVGANGSGKSTLLRLLTGLCAPSAGGMTVNGLALTAQNRPAYRQLISAVFSDFHLFSKLYGLRQIAPQAVTPWLTKLGLAHKTSLVDGRFTTRDLSTGQRKRLALVVALLEDRPIFVFDEWAADQDPEFRRYFYLEVLPMLKQQGKVVIAVTHDDRYFHCADRVVRMGAGQVLSIVEQRQVADPRDRQAPGKEG